MHTFRTAGLCLILVPLMASAADPPAREVPDLSTPGTIAPGHIDPAKPHPANAQEARRQALNERAADPLTSQTRYCQLPYRRFELCR